MASLTIGLGIVAPAATLAQDRSAPRTRVERELASAEEIYQQALAERAEGDRERSDQSLQRAERQFRGVIELDPGNIEATARLGTILFARNKSRDAIPLLQNALRVHPEAMPLKHQLGLNLFAANRGREGRPLLEEVTRADPDLYDAHLVLAQFYYRTAHEYDAAVAAYRAYLRARPSALADRDASIYGAMGNAMLAAQRYSQARPLYQKVISLDERNIPARINIAYSYYMEGNYGEAVTRYEALLRLGSPPAVVLANLSRSLLKQGKARLALVRARQLQRVHQRSHLGHLVEAEALTATGRPREALAPIRLALERAPRDVPTLIMAAKAHQATGDATRAMQHLETARRVDPNDLDVFLALAGLYRTSRRERDALPLYERIVARRPRDADARYGIGACHYALGNNEGALAAFQAALEQRADHAPAKKGLAMTHNRLGVDLLRRNDAAGAQAAFERAVAVDPSAKPPQRNLGELLLRQGNAEGALSHLERIATDDDPDGAYLLGRAYLALNRPAEALTALQKAARTRGSLPAGEVGLALGAAQSLNGQHDDAVTTLRRAVANDRSGEEARLLALALWRRAADHLDNGRDRQAQADLDAVGQHARSLSDVERERLQLTEAVALLASGDGRRALPKLQRLRRTAAAFLAADLREVGIDYLLMHARYLVNDYRGFFTSLRTVRGRAPAALEDRLARLELNARMRSAEALFTRGSFTQAASEITAIRRLGNVGANDGTVRLADACLLYARGRRDEAGNMFAELSRRIRGTGEGDVPREALLDLGIYRDQVRRDHAGAVEAYSQYIAARGRHSDIARRLIQRKRRVLGIGGEEGQ